MNQPFMKPSELEELTGLSRMTVNRMLRAGELPATKVRNRWLINRKKALEQLGLDQEEVTA